LLRSVLVECREAASSVSFWAAARASSRSLMAAAEAAATEGPEGEAMGASAASREAACLAVVRRGAVQSTRARERQGGGRSTRRAPGAEAEERRGKVRLIPYWTMSPIGLD
jgi:hypothetical protein